MASVLDFDEIGVLCSDAQAPIREGLVPARQRARRRA